MHSVLFQTDKPTEAEGRAEFYELYISQLDVDGKQRHLLLEAHGWWDVQRKVAVMDENVPRRPVMFNSYSDALSGFCGRRLGRIKAGFRHSFIWHPVTGIPSYYTYID
jgi:hypothetical protein